MKSFDVIVIGAGILGCFAARALAKYDLSIALLEKREDVCTGISKANTAIVYSGYDNKPHTLKAKLCTEGNANFARLCQELDVKFDRCGSLMVCFGERGAEILRQKYATGQANGVPGLRLLNRQEVLALEPNLNPDLFMGLLAPTTGTVNPWELTIAAYENAIANGCQAYFNQQIIAISKSADGYQLKSAKETFSARAVINCSGLFADQVKEMLSPPQLRIYPTKADYYVLDSKAKGFIRHIILHEPEEKGKGLTLVPTVEGNLLIGPSEQHYTGAKDDYATTEAGLDFLNQCCAKVAPALPLEQIIRNFASLRPNPYYVAQNAAGEYQQLTDKKISGFELCQDQRTPGFFSMIGIKTPGMTCAEGLGRYAASAVAGYLQALPSPTFNPRRTAIPKISELSLSAKNALIEEDATFGNIVCRCNNISEGEVIAALHRGATTVNGVKRRVGTGMGRCQGGYCLQKVIELIAKELHIALSDVTLDGKGSEIIPEVCHE